MDHFQLSLFYDMQLLIQVSPFHRKYFLIFNSLDLSEFHDVNFKLGRNGYSRHAMLKAFIIKTQEEIKSVPKLITFLQAHPILAEMCGFSMGALPHPSQFYRFLSETKNSQIEKVHYSVNKKLIEKNIISMKHFIMDSKPIMAATKENNFKNPHRNATYKHKTPKRNPSATLSYYSYQEVNGKKNNFIFYWGYRTHVIVSKEGIPLIELTLPNKYTDAKVAIKLIKKLKRVYCLKKGAIFIADAAYDERELYTFIIEQLKCYAFIPINPRNKQKDKTFGPHGYPLCNAGLEMKSNGSWTENIRTRVKYRCPIKVNKKIAQKYPLGCPCCHSSFCTGKAYGCTKYLDVTDDARARVPRDSELFKKTFKIRTEVERYFARMGEREAEQTTHYNMKIIKNQMTIAHLAMSLIAYAAAIIMKQPEKIRCYDTFAKDPLPKCA